MLSAATIGPIWGILPIFASLLVVASVFFLAYGFVWALNTKLGARLTARVTGHSESHAGGWRFVATGLGGYFVLLVLLTFGGMYFIINLLSKVVVAH